MSETIRIASRGTVTDNTNDGTVAKSERIPCTPARGRHTHHQQTGAEQWQCHRLNVLYRSEKAALSY